jgi:hypothetical protein
MSDVNDEQFCEYLRMLQVSDVFVTFADEEKPEHDIPHLRGSITTVMKTRVGINFDEGNYREIPCGEARLAVSEDLCTLRASWSSKILMIEVVYREGA